MSAPSNIECAHPGDHESKTEDISEDMAVVVALIGLVSVSILVYNAVRDLNAHQLNK
jgi:hypothetical protein